ncbi:hypothetical protein Fuma_03053 [Fuerstiella marisgermanici]|uniref:Uncharacterized protein n=1 Tax=Fuerstiella marisgermanici TaxID=1891926 RepID=A0A1P8WHA9_9PLAN|nr:hypothetical protein Fuma_03053 [Fuerstiella marisgermanici]
MGEEILRETLGRAEMGRFGFYAARECGQIGRISREMTFQPRSGTSGCVRCLNGRMPAIMACRPDLAWFTRRESFTF